MLRGIGGVVLGYLSMAIVVFASLTVVYVVIGADGAYKEGVYDVSALWIALSFVVGFVAALAGGLVCAAIAAGRTAPKVLAGLVLVFGLLSAFLGYQRVKEPSPARPADVALFDAISQSRQPVFVAVLNPIIGVVGIVIGASLLKKRSE